MLNLKSQLDICITKGIIILIKKGMYVLFSRVSINVFYEPPIIQK